MSSGGGLSIALWQHGAALALVATDIVARAARSSALLPVGLTRATIVNCCGDAVAAITPARLGGDPIRFVWFTRGGIPGSAVLASFATETIVNAVVLGAGAILLLGFFAELMWPLTVDLVQRASSGPRLAVTLGALAICALVLFIFVRRATRWRMFALDAWRSFRMQSRGTVTRAAVYTVVSMLARTAILPVLLARTPGIGTGALILGSVAALYALLLAPTPGGVGPIEAGFFAGFGDALDVRDVAALLVAWRAYAWLCGAAIGALLLLRERWMRKAADR
ncbi:MAG TPA: YbhN family protein [Gemmatimonadaceae bacterium]|nr:YbhN family protein [Gemmatimonadaceae bacterium]